MNVLGSADRRMLARALSRAASASVQEVLLTASDGPGSCRTIGITGAPGVGKSSLIARLAKNRLRHERTLGIVAIDPTSPISGGAVLGDRIRMQDLAGDPRIFIRSLASRSSKDGLADNLADILAVFDGAGFSELIVETVGVGQVGYAVRSLVDTHLLVVMPGAGDQIQAMKGGILETADICVVNKSDLPGARQLAGELRVVFGRGAGDAGEAWNVPVILASAQDQTGIDELGAAIDRHQAWLEATGGHEFARRDRCIHHVGSLVARRTSEILRGLSTDELDRPVAELYGLVVRELAASLAPTGISPHSSATKMNIAGRRP
jgi:GTPase